MNDTLRAIFASEYFCKINGNRVHRRIGLPKPLAASIVTLFLSDERVFV
jgi:hypothetical protein